MTTVLHDTVTLRHFAAVERNNILEKRHADKPEPRWSDTVQHEIADAAKHGTKHCDDILQWEWLGEPACPDANEMKKVHQIRIALAKLDDPSHAHLGEAESIFYAEKTGGQLATDDAAAYEFAKTRSTLGPGRVIDSITILRAAVADGDITADDAAQVAEAIEAAGRFFRPEHRRPRNASYFTR